MDKHRAPCGSALGSPPFLQACFPGWECWGGGEAEVRAPFQSVGFHPGWGAWGGNHNSGLSVGPSPAFCPHRRLPWRSLCPVHGDVPSQPLPGPWR